MIIFVPSIFVTYKSQNLVSSLWDTENNNLFPSGAMSSTQEQPPIPSKIGFNSDPSNLKVKIIHSREVTNNPDPPPIGVDVGKGVREGVGVGVRVGVWVGVLVFVGRGVSVGVAVAVGEGASEAQPVIYKAKATRVK